MYYKQCYNKSILVCIPSSDFLGSIPTNGITGPKGGHTSKTLNSYCQISHQDNSNKAPVRRGRRGGELVWQTNVQRSSVPQKYIGGIKAFLHQLLPTGGEGILNTARSICEHQLPLRAWAEESARAAPAPWNAGFALLWHHGIVCPGDEQRWAWRTEIGRRTTTTDAFHFGSPRKKNSVRNEFVRHTLSAVLIRFLKWLQVSRRQNNKGNGST